MVPIETWNGPSVIFEGLNMHAEELISLGQEVEFWGKWDGARVATIRSFDPRKEMIVFIPSGDHEEWVIDIPSLLVMKVLPYRKMTPALAYAQMEEMARYVGK